MALLFNSGSSGTIDYATIKHAKKGVKVTSTNNVTIDNCTFQNFTEQAVYASNSSLTVQNSTIQNPSGASHGIYLLGGSGNPTIKDNTIKSVTIGIERKDSPGVAVISGNTFTFCRDGIKTIQSSPEIYNNYVDGSGTGDHGIRVGTGSSPDIHDNDFFRYSIGVYVEQSEPSDLKWNNFGYSNGQMKPNEDNALRINYLTSGNTFADNNWNNFYDDEATDVFNSTSTTLKARGNYWDSQTIEGPVDASNPQSSANSNAGPGGSLGKQAGLSSEEPGIAAGIPERYALEQNYPNPFNPSTTIHLNLPEPSTVTVAIYDILGRHVKTLVSNRFFQTGTHKLSWNGTDDAGKSVASGVYLYRLKAVSHQSNQTFTESRKLFLCNRKLN